MLFNRRSALRLVLLSGIAAFGLVSAPLAGGGIALFVDIPREDTDSRLRDAVFIARARGCAGPGATFHITAEGLVNGKRVSKVLTPIDATPTDKSVASPIFGIRREWPQEGNWVVSIIAHSAPYCYPEMKNGKPTGKRVETRLEESVIVPILPDGTPQMRVTPGAKYEKFVDFIRIASENREKAIVKILSAPVTIAQTNSRNK